jgi:4-hydroxybenzoate polyprenyltransferase
MNDLADRELDCWVSRTKKRPLPSKRITTGGALVVLGILLTLAALLLLFLDPFTRWLSLGGLAIAILYPFTKRYIHFPQLVMGIAFGWGALMAWTAVRHTLELPALLIFAATLFWATGYDTIYALLDRDDDIKVGIKSTAILFKRYTWIALAALFGLASLFLLLLGLRTERTSIYYFTLVLITLSFGYQVFKVRGNPDEPMTFSLFKSHVGIGMLVLTGILLDFWRQRWMEGIP